MTTQPDERLARELLKAECQKSNCSFLVNRKTGELDDLGQAAIRAILAALQSTLAEREAVVESLREVARSFREGQFRDGVEYAANSIERGDHAPSASEAGEAEDDG